MEPPTEMSDNPPNYIGSIGMSDSPDTLSVCSDAFTDDLDITASSPDTREVDDNDQGGLQKKFKKQWSSDISFEGMLMTAAAAAKKFKAERQKEINKLKRSQSADNTQLKDRDLGAESTLDQHFEIGGPQRKLSSDADVVQLGERVDVQGTILEKQSPLLSKKIHEQSPCHSDDSESRQSGNEAGALEEETLEK